jgi:hypothetical protein
LNATAYLGVDDVRITCMSESVTHPRARFGTRQVRYRHYLPELARKPHAVRQVAPELIAELHAPWSGLWGLGGGEQTVAVEVHVTPHSEDALHDGCD